MQKAPIDLKTLDVIPGDVVSASIVTWDLPEAYEHTLRTTERAIERYFASVKPSAGPPRRKSLSRNDWPPVTREMVSRPGWISRQIHDLTGLDIKAEFLAPLGRHLVNYQLREFAGASINLAIELKDSKAFEVQLDKWLKLLPPQVQFKPKQVGQRTLQVLDLQGTQIPAFALSPCYALADNWLFIASSSAAGTRFLNLLNGSDTKPLSTRDEIRKFLAEHERDKLSRITFSDQSASLQTLYPTLAMFYPLLTKGITDAIAQESGRRTASGPAPTIEFAPLPAFEVFDKHMLTTISYSLLQGERRVSVDRQ